MKSERGLTLVELLITATILSLVMMATLTMYRSGIFAYTKYRERQEHTDQCEVVLATLAADLRGAAEHVVGAFKALHAFVRRCFFGVVTRTAGMSAGVTGLAGMMRRRRIRHIVAFLHILHAFKANRARQHCSGRRAEVKGMAIAAIPYMALVRSGIIMEVIIVPIAGLVVTVAGLAGKRHIERDGLLNGLREVYALVEVHVRRAGYAGHTETD